jgi:hypothetical protein
VTLSDWPKYLLVSLLAIVALMLGYLIVDQTGAVHKTEYVEITQTDHSDAWTEYKTISIPIGDHGETMEMPQTTEWPETWTFNFETQNGTVSHTYSQPEAAKLLCCTRVRIHYRLGRLSHTPIDLSFETQGNQ